MANTTRAVPGRPVRQMPMVAATDMSSDRPAPMKATHVRFSAIGVGSENSRCRKIAVASSTAENTAIRLVQRAKNDGPRGGGDLMRGAALAGRVLGDDGGHAVASYCRDNWCRRQRIAQNRAKNSD